MSPPPLAVLSVQINGTTLSDGATGVSPTAQIVFTFSEQVDPGRFGQAFSLMEEGGADVPVDIRYTGGGARVEVEAVLAFETTYQLDLSTEPIGQSGSALAMPLRRRFTTIEEGMVASLAPCTAAGTECLRTLMLSGNMGTQGTFGFYSSFPLDASFANQSDLRGAIIAVHGQNRNADDYFRYLTASLQQAGLTDEVLLIAPFFSGGSSTPGQVFWSTRGWREGQSSDDVLNISSFEVIDEILAAVGDTDQFPAMEQIVITGHSSGGLFTHVYAAANTTETQYPDLDFQYVVANSQYFYYPEDVRFDPITETFTEPTNCPTFNQWPQGFVGTPNYLGGQSETTVDRQLVERQVTYLLGTRDTVTTGSLNTTDCAAVALGENRFKRGTYILRLMNTFYADTHRHAQLLVPDVGHNAEGMYQSPAFLEWLEEAF